MNKQYTCVRVGVDGTLTTEILSEWSAIGFNSIVNNVRRDDGSFKCFTVWSMNDASAPYRISVWGNDDDFGADLMINKFDFPPPIDNQITFGNMVVVKEMTGSSDVKIIPCSLDVAEWNKIYEKLFGGFEDIGSEEESEEEEVYDDDQYTKDGYLKDDFVVDSEEESDEEESEEGEDESEDVWDEEDFGRDSSW